MNLPKRYVPKKLTEMYSFFNLHAGNIQSNRGANPIVRSILLNHTISELTLHKINHKIDLGTIVNTFPVQISLNDNLNTIKSNMESGIPFLLKQLVLFLSGNITGSEVAGGKYYKPISREDYTINLESDTKDVIYNKIRSQITYAGAILNWDDKSYYIKKIIDWSDSKTDSIEVKIENSVMSVQREFEEFKLLISL